MIEILSGTNRRGSNTRKVVAEISGIWTELQVEHGILDLLDLPGGMLHPDAYGEKPATFAPFAERILAADGLLVVTPEYNGSFPGVLKYFIDMLEFPASLKGRPAAFVGLSAGQWGGLRSVEQLQAIFLNLGANLYPGRVFLPGIGGLLDDAGKIKDSELKARLATQAKGFVNFVAILTGKV